MRKSAAWSAGTAMLLAALALAPSSGPARAVAPVEVAPATLADAQFEVGPARRIAGPSSLFDSNFASIPRPGGGVRGYIANISSYQLEGPDMEHLTADLTTKVLQPNQGDKTAFDHCGAWLQGLWVDPGNAQHVFGWFHAEGHCNPDPWQQSTQYAAKTIRRSIGRVESFDGGRTFKNKGQVMTSGAAEVAGQTTGEGNPTAVVKGGYLYVPFTEKTSTSQLVSMARAALNPGPGAFSNWTGSAWNGPALGSTGATINGIGGGTAAGLSTPGDEMVVVSSELAGGGVWLRYSKSLGSFTKAPDPLVPLAAGDTRTWSTLGNTTFQMLAYPAVAAPAGGNAFSDTFYLVTMYVQPGGDMNHRYLVRRKVTVRTRPVGDPGSLIALTQYRSGQDSMATTSLAPEGYVEGARLGFLPTRQLTGTLPLLECSSSGDRFLSKPVSGKCSAGTLVRTIGFVWETEVAGSSPLYDCKPASGDRFVSADAACGGAALGNRLGWFRSSPAAAPPAAPAIGFSASPTYGKPTTITVTGPANGTSVSIKVGSAAPVMRTITSGKATLVLQAGMAAGSYTVSASDGQETGTRTLVIAKAYPAIAESFPAATSVGGKASGTVTVSLPGSTVVPGGRVQIRQGTKVLVGWAALSSGKVFFTLPRLSPLGVRTLVIYYEGTPSISARTLSFTVEQR